jgi:hypothetical protein
MTKIEDVISLRFDEDISADRKYALTLLFIYAMERITCIENGEEVLEIILKEFPEITIRRYGL